MKNKYSELINELSDKELITHLYSTQILLLIISFVSGMIVFDEFPFLNQIRWNDPNIIYFGISIGLGIVLLDVILMKVLPKSYYDDGGLNVKIFSNRSIPHIAVIALMVAVSEELLFRGVIQTTLGMIVASVIFAIIHYRYLFSPFLLINIILLSFLIGFVFEWTGNLAVTIVMHFIIDFLLGIHIKYKNVPKLDCKEEIQ
ncbi:MULTISPECIES: CPBP family intramembrane glutamic endopeptidase [unclassified Bacillus (in: firmicutes)]|nr:MULTISPECIES: CPBP family intramembrane glutamic endopeptidase [unclassified Bacillus (in: firmicutes)]